MTEANKCRHCAAVLGNPRAKFCSDRCRMRHNRGEQPEQADPNSVAQPEQIDPNEPEQNGQPEQDSPEQATRTEVDPNKGEQPEQPGDSQEFDPMVSVDAASDDSVDMHDPSTWPSRVPGEKFCCPGEFPEPEARELDDGPVAPFELVPDTKFCGRQAVRYPFDMFDTRPMPDDPDDEPCQANRSIFTRPDGTRYCIDSCGQAFDRIGGEYQPQVA